MSITGKSGLVYDEQGFLVMQRVDNNVQRIAEFLLKQQQETQRQFSQQQALRRTHHQQVSGSNRVMVQQLQQINQRTAIEAKKSNTTSMVARRVDVAKPNVQLQTIQAKQVTSDKQTVKKQHKPQQRDELGRFTAKNDKANENTAKNNQSLAKAIGQAVRDAYVDTTGVDPTLDALSEVGQVLKPVGKMAGLTFKPLSSIAKLRKRNEPLPKEEVEHNRKQLKLLQRIADVLAKSDNGILSKLGSLLKSILPTLGGVLSGGKKSKDGKKPSKLKGALKYAKRIPYLGAVANALDFYDWNDKTVEEKGNTVGSLGGGVAGAMIGGAIGSVVPVVGTAIGMGLGSIVGSFAGGELGEIVAPYFKQWTDRLINANIPEFLKQKWTGLIDSVSTGFYHAVQTVSSVVDMVGNGLSNIINSISSTVGNIFKGIESKAQQVMNALLNAIPSEIKTAYNTAVDVTSQGIEAVANGVNKVTSFFSDAYNSAVNWTSEAIGKGVELIKPSTAQELHNKAKDMKLFKDQYSTDGGLAHAGTYTSLINAKSLLGDNFLHSASVNDKYHQRKSPNSMHVQGLAHDITLKNGKQSTQAVERLIAHYQAMGMTVSSKYAKNNNYSKDTDIAILDEYAFPSKNATGGHLHIQFNNKQAAERYYAMQTGQISKPQRTPVQQPKAHLSDIANATVSQMANGRWTSNNAILDRMIAVESMGNASAHRNGSQYQGLMQLGEDVRKQFSVKNGFDAVQNFEGAKKFMLQNAKGLQQAGIPINATTLYLAHNQGLAGIKAIWKSAQNGTEVSAGIRNNMNSNGGRGKSAKEFLAYWEQRIESNYQDFVKNFKGGQAIPNMGEMMALGAESLQNVGSQAIGQMNPLMMLPFGEVKKRERLQLVDRLPSTPSVKITPSQQQVNTPKPQQVVVVNQQQEQLGQNIHDRMLAHSITGGIGEWRLS